jgi:hypothetical protein
VERDGGGRSNCRKESFFSTYTNCQIVKNVCYSQLWSRQKVVRVYGSWYDVSNVLIVWIVSYIQGLNNNGSWPRRRKRRTKRKTRRRRSTSERWKFQRMKGLEGQLGLIVVVELELDVRRKD